MAKERGQEEVSKAPKRVIIEHQDGTISYLEGDSAQKWDDTLHDLVVWSDLHGMGQEELKSLEWKKAANIESLSQEPDSTFLLFRGCASGSEVIVVHAETVEKAWETIVKNLREDPRESGNKTLMEVKNGSPMSVIQLRR